MTTLLKASRQVAKVKAAVIEAIPAGVDKANVIIALAQVIQAQADLIIESDIANCPHDHIETIGRRFECADCGRVIGGT